MKFCQTAKNCYDYLHWLGEWILNVVPVFRLVFCWLTFPKKVILCKCVESVVRVSGGHWDLFGESCSVVTFEVKNNHDFDDSDDFENQYTFAFMLSLRCCRRPAAPPPARCPGWSRRPCSTQTPPTAAWVCGKEIEVRWRKLAQRQNAERN